MRITKEDIVAALDAGDAGPGNVVCDIANRVAAIVVDHIGPWGVCDLVVWAYFRHGCIELHAGSENEWVGDGCWRGSVLYRADEAWPIIRELGAEEACLPDGVSLEEWSEAGEEYDALDEARVEAYIAGMRARDPEALLAAAGHPRETIVSEVLEGLYDLLAEMPSERNVKGDEHELGG
ncbi:MAG: hypothetical protein K6U87_04105 [Firmicutes bacterium]|nr:hypothetical protein [Bacillota bacterium]